MPLYDASKLQKFKNRLLYEDTRAENMNADKLNTVLRNLIECVKVEEFERPTLDSIASKMRWLRIGNRIATYRKKDRFAFSYLKRLMS